MEKIYKRITETGIIPVINIQDADKAVPLAHALRDGGIPAIEITLRTGAALSSIEKIRDAYPDMLIGAGTVLQREQIDASIAAGADFIVSPGFNPKNVQYCCDKGITIFPGAVTASDIELGIEMGLSIFKFFPCEQAGGLDAINLLGGPFGNIKFIPTGGISFTNLSKFMDNKKVAAVGGSFIAKPAMIDEGDWGTITALSKEAVKISLGFEMAHIGINNRDSESAIAAAKLYSDIFGLQLKDGNSSIFAGRAVECMKTMYHGEKGHIGFCTSSMERALANLRARGVAFRDDEIKYDKSGNLVAAYLKDEIAGFAVHIVQK